MTGAYQSPECREACRFCIAESFRESGGGNSCRTLETITGLVRANRADKQGAASLAFGELFRRLAADETVSVSRIDIACDDWEGFLNMEEIVEKVRTNALNSRMTKRSVVVSYDGIQRSGSTVYIGALSSDFRARIYDKAREEGIDGHWVPVELVMRQKNANAFVEHLLAAESVGRLAAQVINDKFSFIERDDSNITRCTVCGWWLSFVEELESVRLVARCVIQHSAERVENWLESQVGPSLAVILQTLGWPHIFEITHAAIGRLSEKQLYLISDYNALKTARAGAVS